MTLAQFSFILQLVFSAKGICSSRLLVKKENLTLWPPGIQVMWYIVLSSILTYLFITENERSEKVAWQVSAKRERLEKEGKEGYFLELLKFHVKNKHKGINTEGRLEGTSLTWGLMLRLGDVDMYLPVIYKFLDPISRTWKKKGEEGRIWM